MGIDWAGLLLGIAVGIGVVVVIVWLSRRVKSNILAGAENVIEGLDTVLADTPFMQKYGQVMDVIMDLVRGAEQLKKAGQIDSKEAKVKVKETAKEVLEEMGLQLNDHVLDLMIESAVFLVNRLFPKKSGDSETEKST